MIKSLSYLPCLKQIQSESFFPSYEKKQGMTSKAYGATGPTERCRTCKGTGKITRKDKEVCSLVYTDSFTLNDFRFGDNKAQVVTLPVPRTVWRNALRQRSHRKMRDRLKDMPPHFRTVWRPSHTKSLSNLDKNKLRAAR